MVNRRDFIKKTALGSMGISAIISCRELAKDDKKTEALLVKTPHNPIIIST